LTRVHHLLGALAAGQACQERGCREQLERQILHVVLPLSVEGRAAAVAPARVKRSALALRWI